MALCSGLSWGIYFFAYNRAKERYQRWYDTKHLAPQYHLSAAAEAGGVVRGGASKACIVLGMM